MKKVGKKFGSFKKNVYLCIVIKNYKLFHLFTHGQEHNKTTKHMKSMKEIKHRGMKKSLEIPMRSQMALHLSPIGSTKWQKEKRVLLKLRTALDSYVWFIYEGEELDNGDWRLFGDRIDPKGVKTEGVFSLKDLESQRDEDGYCYVSVDEQVFNVYHRDGWYYDELPSDNKSQDKDNSNMGIEYKVSRTSAWSDTKPCEEAYRKEGEEYDRYVRINSLEDLMNFIKKYGKVVVNEGYIEIYDDWRE